MIADRFRAYSTPEVCCSKSESDGHRAMSRTNEGNIYAELMSRPPRGWGAGENPCWFVPIQ